MYKSSSFAGCTEVGDRENLGAVCQPLIGQINYLFTEQNTIYITTVKETCKYIIDGPEIISEVKWNLKITFKFFKLKFLF